MKRGADIVSFLKVNSFPTLISYVNKERAEALVGFDIEGLKHFYCRVTRGQFITDII